MDDFVNIFYFFVIVCSENCVGKINGARCYENNHCGCPGECYQNECFAY